MSRTNVTENFVFGGRAVFTVSSATGERYTYKVVKSKPNAKYTSGAWFLLVLSGPDNERSYEYVGIVDRQTMRLIITKKSSFSDESMAVKAFRWAAGRIVSQGEIPDGYSIVNAGLCCRCGRLLTTPESIKSGFGPTCRKSVEE